MKLSSTADGAARVVLHAETVEQAVLDRAGEPHREQHQIHIHLKFGVRNQRKLAAFEFHPLPVELGDMAVVSGKLGRRHAPLPVAAFFMRMRRP